MKKRVSLPGPGNYRAPSEFGQYDGRIYEAFSNNYDNSKSFIRLQTDFDGYNSRSKSLQRPSTSKH